MYPVASTEPGQDEKARDALVNAVRDIARGGDGLSVEVGGAGALATDACEVYNSLDGPLLYTTAAVVALLLILIYRSPFLWLVPLAVAGIADYLSWASPTASTRGSAPRSPARAPAIMTILVFGAGTDYALLLVSRYREELRRVERPYDAMAAALRGCGPAVLASSGTVAAGLLCLLAADLNSSRGMGPLGTVGVLCALAAMLTLLPALLVLLGRRVFWPLVPRYGSTPKARRSLFTAMGGSAERRPRTVLVGGAVLLGALALGAFALPGSLKQEDSFTTRPDAIAAMETLAAAYPERGTQPITVIAPTDRADGRSRRGPRHPRRQERRGGSQWRRLDRTDRTRLRPAPVGGRDRHHRVPARLARRLLRRRPQRPADRPGGHQRPRHRHRRPDRAAVGAADPDGAAAVARRAADPGRRRGRRVGRGARHRRTGLRAALRLRGHRPRTRPAVLRVPGRPRRRLRHLPDAPHARGVLRGAEPSEAALSALRTTGGVIASAGLVLAATFAVLTSMPMVQLVELGFVIAVGVLLDTFLVRTYLVTSASVACGAGCGGRAGSSRAPGEPAAAGEREPVGV